ncbi:hypothetical protein [Candidatus Hecatella orcuttiae]|jgi:hypothetical protein|uniref:hypothetical protein n=1 Tax=Candidatus Hecatella orcuttiae TaxID=1935119 RepID=UPI002868009E|nr:hypothetical protein [Candidatus Hecatella orcuttiae]
MPVPKGYPVRITRWSSTSRVKRGRKKYWKLVLNFPQKMAPELEDLLGRPAVAWREGSRVIIQFQLAGNP